MHTRIKSKIKTQTTETPDHLQIVEGFDFLPFQRLWEAYQRAQIAKGAEDIAVVTKCRTLVEISAISKEVIDYARNSLCD